MPFSKIIFLNHYPRTPIFILKTEQKVMIFFGDKPSLRMIQREYKFNDQPESPSNTSQEILIKFMMALKLLNSFQECLNYSVTI